MVLGWKEGLVCEVLVYGKRLKFVFEFKYFGCVQDGSGTGGAEWEEI